ILHEINRFRGVRSLSHRWLRLLYFDFAGSRETQLAARLTKLGIAGSARFAGNDGGRQLGGSNSSCFALSSSRANDKRSSSDNSNNFRARSAASRRVSQS